MNIDTLVMILGDQNAGKSNQMRTLFVQPELRHEYGGYPKPSMIARRYLVDPDAELLIRLSSWHERSEAYTDVKRDISNGRVAPQRRYKVCIPAQVTATKSLMAGENLFIRLAKDFKIRRSFAVWLNPDRSGLTPFALSPTFAAFLSAHPEASALAIDSLALHPSADPQANSINSLLLADLLFKA
jgi:hypothetical protein